jgi:hypothetical protein
MGPVPLPSMILPSPRGAHDSAPDHDGSFVCLGPALGDGHIRAEPKCPHRTNWLGQAETGESVDMLPPWPFAGDFYPSPAGEFVSRSRERSGGYLDTAAPPARDRLDGGPSLSHGIVVRLKKPIVSVTVGLLAFLPRCFGGLREQAPGLGSAKMRNCRLEQIGRQALNCANSRTSLFDAFGKQGGRPDSQSETISFIPSGVIRRKRRERQQFAGTG